MSTTTEAYKPALHVAPVGWLGKALFGARRVADFQVATVYRALKIKCASFTGTVVDIGCGEMPYRQLLPDSVNRYIGLEVASNEVWRRQSEEVRLFDGQTLPFSDASVDGILCTEVLEHCQEPERLIREMHRVLKPGCTLIATVPWSARYHYIPHDYFRYTPSCLQYLFGAFEKVEVEARGTDIVVICAKSIVVFLRSVASLKRPANWWLLPLLILASPLFPLLVLAGQISLRLKLGSEDDPLGYVITARK